MRAGWGERHVRIIAYPVLPGCRMIARMVLGFFAGAGEQYRGNWSRKARNSVFQARGRSAGATRFRWSVPMIATHTHSRTP